MRIIPSLPGFFATSEGQVVNRDGVVLATRHSPRGPEVRPKTSGRTEVRLLAALVLEAYSGQAPGDLHPQHRDGDLTNTRPDNLHWGEAMPLWAAPEGFAPVPGYGGRYATDGKAVFDRRKNRLLRQTGGRVNVMTPGGQRYKVRVTALV
jgi:hypothetical protein